MCLKVVKTLKMELIMNQLNFDIEIKLRTFFITKTKIIGDFRLGCAEPYRQLGYQKLFQIIIRHFLFFPNFSNLYIYAEKQLQCSFFAQLSNRIKCSLSNRLATLHYCAISCPVKSVYSKTIHGLKKHNSLQKKNRAEQIHN